MAALKQKIQQDLTTALREKKELELSVLRMLNAAIINKEKEKRYKISKEKLDLAEAELEKESGLLEDEILEIIFSEIKKRKEAALLFEKGKRTDLSEKEKAEAKILEKYLPEQPRAQNNFVLGRAPKHIKSYVLGAPISEEEIKKLAGEIIKKNGAKEIKEMGKIMAELMPKIKGRADGSLVSKIVKEILEK